MIRQSQRTRQTRTFNAEKIDQAGHTVLAGIAHAKIRHRLMLDMDLWTDAGKIRLQRIVREIRPIAADRLIETLRTTMVDGKVLVVLDPFDVRTESAPALKIKCRMDAETGSLGNRVNQMLEGLAPDKTEIIALGIGLSRHECAGQSLRPRRDADGAVTGSVDDDGRRNRDSSPVIGQHVQFVARL